MSVARTLTRHLHLPDGSVLFIATNDRTPSYTTALEHALRRRFRIYTPRSFPTLTHAGPYERAMIDYRVCYSLRRIETYVCVCARTRPRPVCGSF